MSAQNLPSEICQEVFELLPQRTVYQCIFVCKSWNMTAIPTYYRELSLTGNKITCLKSLLNDYKYNMPQILAYGDRVRCLKIHQDFNGSEKLDLVEFYVLLSHLSRLKRIDLGSTNKYISYLNKLQTIDTTKVPNFLKHLQEISVVFNSSYVPDGKMQYFLACYNFRKSLTRLQLHHLRQTLSIGEQSGNYLYFLPQFKKLTHLSIVNDHMNGVVDLSIYPIFSTCPNLKEFTLRSCHTINLNPTTTADSSSLTSSKTETATANNSSTCIAAHSVLPFLGQQSQQRTHLFSHCSHLKALSLNVPYLDMKHMLSYISPSLCNLELCITQDIFDVWIQESGADTMTHFAKQLRPISNWSITVNNGNSTNSRRSTLTKAVTNMTLQDRLNNYTLFTSAASGNLNLICHLTLVVFPNREPICRFHADVRNGKLTVVYGLCIKNDAEMGLLPRFLHGAYDDEMKLPDLYSLVVNIQEYRINMIGDTMDQILSHAIFNCPHLTSININNEINGNCYRFRSQLFDPLQNDNNIITPRKYKHFITKPSTLKNLTHCIIKNTTLSPQLLNILNNSFQNMKTLIFFDCTFVRDDYNNIQFDFTGMKHLENFELDAHRLDIRHRRHVCLQIEFLNHQGEESTLHYKCEESSSTRGVSLTPISSKFIKSYRRETSFYTTIVNLKFSKIDVFTLSRLYYGAKISSVDIQLGKTITATSMITHNK